MPSTVVDARSAPNGLRAGVASGELFYRDVVIVLMPDCPLIEVMNRGGADDLWLTVSATAIDFEPDRLGCQVVEPGGVIEIPGAGGPRLVMKATHRARWQVRPV